MITKIMKIFRHPGVLTYHLTSNLRVIKCKLNRNIKLGSNTVIEKGVTLSTLGGAKLLLGKTVDCICILSYFHGAEILP